VQPKSRVDKQVNVYFALCYKFF